MPVTSGRSARASRTLFLAARASSRVAPVPARPRRSFRRQVGLELVEHGRDRVREGQALAVAAALIAAREEQRRRLVAERREDQGPAVAALAEGLGRGALDLDLAVEAEIALVVADHEVVELEGRDAPARMAGGAPDLLDEVDLRGGRGGRARQGAHTGERGRLVRDLRIESGQGTVHEVHPRRLELPEPVQGADAVQRALSAVVGAGLED